MTSSPLPQRLQVIRPVGKSLRTVTGNRLFIFGTAGGGIEKSKASFFKEDKKAALRLISPPAVEAEHEFDGFCI